MLQSTPINNSGGGIVLRDAAKVVYSRRADQVVLLNSHHMTVPLMMKLLFSRRPIIHRLAGPMSLARPGVRGSLDDRIVKQIANLADVLVFQSRKSLSLNVGLLGLATSDAHLIHNPPSSGLIEFVRNGMPTDHEPKSRYAIVLNTSNPMKGVAIASELIAAVGAVNAVVIVKSEAMVAKLRDVMPQETNFQVCADPSSFFQFVASHDVAVVPTLFEAGCNSFLEVLALCPVTLVPSEGGLYTYAQELLGEGFEAFRLLSFNSVAEAVALTAELDVPMNSVIRRRRLATLESLRDRTLKKWTELADGLGQRGRVGFGSKLLCFARIIGFKLLQKAF